MEIDPPTTNTSRVANETKDSQNQKNGTRQSRSRTPKDIKVEGEKGKTGESGSTDAEDEDEEEEADEETFAVEKVLNHRIGTKGSVLHASAIKTNHYFHRAGEDFNITLNG